ncbi:MAG: hypothetical protein GY841_19000 [FCB group bacterium]|nr:hypothetical protein [FCB group bacterium]
MAATKATVVSVSGARPRLVKLTGRATALNDKVTSLYFAPLRPIKNYLKAGHGQ